jgi:hypothetical protein
LLVTLCGPALAQEKASVAEKGEQAHQRAAALVQSLKQSQAALRKYEWIETTIISIKDEEKARKLNRCYYGEDGKLQKVPVASDTDDQKKARGIRGRIVEKKKEEMTEYMQDIVRLVHMYVPPDPARIQEVKEAGGLSLHLLEPGKRIRLDFKDYRLKGDTLGVEIDPSANRLLALRVSSYVASGEDPFTCDVRFGALRDGTSYTEQTTLNAPAKNMKVVIENSGFRKIGS